MDPPSIPLRKYVFSPLVALFHHILFEFHHDTGTIPFWRKVSGNDKFLHHSPDCLSCYLSFICEDVNSLSLVINILIFWLHPFSAFPPFVIFESFQPSLPLVIRFPHSMDTRSHVLTVSSINILPSSTFPLLASCLNYYYYFLCLIELHPQLYLRTWSRQLSSTMNFPPLRLFP